MTIIELEKQMLPGFDAEIAEELRRNFVKRKVTVLLGHGYKSMQKVGDKWSVTVTADGAEKKLEAENVLIAVGRVALSNNLGLEKVGIEVERGFIKVDDSFRTTAKTIYAIGDVIRPPLLAHKASAEGVAAVEIMASVREPGFDLLSIAGCIYCEPEVATVGLSEAEAKARGIEVKVGKFPFRALGKAIATNSTEGFVKLVVSSQYGEVVGCQIIGHHATDLISEVVLGKTLEATNIEFGKTIHPASHDVRGDNAGGARGGRRGHRYIDDAEHAHTECRESRDRRVRGGARATDDASNSAAPRRNRRHAPAPRASACVHARPRRR